MNKIRFTSALTAGLLILFTYACSQGQQSNKAASPEPAASEIAADAAAMVNSKPIPMSELKTAVQNVVMQNGMDPGHLDAFMDQFGPRILDQLIDGELLFQASGAEGFKASEEDVESSFAELSGRYNTKEEFQVEMENRGFTEASLKANISRQVSIQKYIEGTILPKAIVPEETVREAYDENPQNFAQEENVTASHILINSAQGDPQEKKDEALERAKDIAAKARAKGADFAELAKTYSEGPSAPSGGALGSFTRGRMVKPFEDAAFSMEVGEISDPVLTQFGYHVIKVTDRTEGKTASFEDVKEQLGEDLKNRMINEMIGQKLSELRDKANIEVLFKPEPQAAPGGAPHGIPMK